MLPMRKLSLNYLKIDYNYVDMTQQPTGKENAFVIRVSYDIMTMRAIEGGSHAVKVFP